MNQDLRIARRAQRRARRRRNRENGDHLGIAVLLPNLFTTFNLAAGFYSIVQSGEGQYERADSGEIANFPGVSSPYEEPVEPDLVLPTHEWPVDRCVDTILQLLEERGIAS